MLLYMIDGKLYHILYKLTFDCLEDDILYHHDE